MNTWTNISVIRTTWNDRNHLWEKFIWCVLWFFSLAHVPSADMEGRGLWAILGPATGGRSRYFIYSQWSLPVSISVYIYLSYLLLHLYLHTSQCSLYLFSYLLTSYLTITVYLIFISALPVHNLSTLHFIHFITAAHLPSTVLYLYFILLYFILYMFYSISRLWACAVYYILWLRLSFLLEWFSFSTWALSIVGGTPRITNFTSSDCFTFTVIVEHMTIKELELEPHFSLFSEFLQTKQSVN